MTELEQAQQTALFAKIVGAGLQSVLSVSLADQVILIGGDREAALSKVIARMQKHISEFRVSSKNAGASDKDDAALQRDIHNRISLMLFGAEEGARSHLGLPKHSERSGH